MSCIVSFPVQIRDLIKAQKQCIGKHVCIKVTTPSFPITSSIANVSLTKFINISSVTFQASGENFFTITTETTGLFTYPDILVTKLLAVAGCAFVVQPIDPGQPFSFMLTMEQVLLHGDPLPLSWTKLRYTGPYGMVYSNGNAFVATSPNTPATTWYDISDTSSVATDKINQYSITLTSQETSANLNTPGVGHVMVDPTLLSLLNYKPDGQVITTFPFKKEFIIPYNNIQAVLNLLSANYPTISCSPPQQPAILNVTNTLALRAANNVLIAAELALLVSNQNIATYPPLELDIKS